MTEISYKGANCIVIQTKQTTVITDPIIDSQKPPKVLQKATVQLASQARFAADVPEGQRLFLIPGEYEIGDVSIKAIAAQAQLDGEGRKATVYKIESSDCTIATLGHINPKTFNDEQFEALGVVDVLILPVGGNGYTIDAHDAVTLTRHIDPKLVIPVHFAEDGVAYEVAQNSIEQFIKELSVSVQSEMALKIKQPGSLPETLTLVRLEKTT
ncbi:MAG TPA: MBL fold metallo-hydrolase [Candidatus Saccharimonadales bacterium]